MALLQVLEERMEYYSNDEKADTINRVRGGISEVKNVMIENIDKVRFYGTLLVCG
jgi:vesicle-associated membrane protein 7